ncbi:MULTISPECIES: hypothetical protein [Acetobacteraceae]|uniref:Uncharacterized protein n=2 Tax=Acetobacteraceae TaxID=433 RepID=A0A023D146_ACIMT|nr:MULTISPECIES: hypothetical protein [Acetobacteraceae]KXV74182.1 hypothetical protein AD953_12835 [Acetobacter malorum]TCS25120.1 hypothetical protein EDC31_12040 [Acidomonas methanolica]GAJ27878.1 hypothetical protein Amme_009_015 [Acidomonas methanolica NBRC 104435]GBQ46085.1 hypothetical protein AA0498_0204 [Acidomonas methanolica]GEK99791.1 hypothetical protein AME01nite_22900 [Acidomonas methanolica NBRC 104435]
MNHDNLDKEAILWARLQIIEYEFSPEQTIFAMAKAIEVLASDSRLADDAKAKIEEAARVISHLTSQG